MDNARFKTFTIHYIINNEWHKRIYDDTFLIHSILPLYLRVVTPISGIPDSSLVLDRLPVICRKMVEVKSGFFCPKYIQVFFTSNVFKTRKALFNLSIKPKTILRGYPFSTTKVSYNQQQQRSTCFNYCRHLIDIDTWGRKLRDHRDLALILVF